MSSKYDKIQVSITNIEAAIKYYLKDIKSSQNKMTKSEYIKTIKSLNGINSIVNSLKFEKPYEDSNLNTIRGLNLSIKDLYDEEGDYNAIFNEIIKIHNNSCKNVKEEDRKKLTEFKKIFNSLSNFYKYRLTKAEIKPNEGLVYRDKGLDNFKFIIEKYLDTKYNLKKVKYETVNISNENSQLIDKCTQMIESNNYDEHIKKIYALIKICIEKYAKAEIIIKILKKIQELCTQKEYYSIKEQVEKTIQKYQKKYKDNQEECHILIELLHNKGIELNTETKENNITKAKK